MGQYPSDSLLLIADREDAWCEQHRALAIRIEDWLATVERVAASRRAIEESWELLLRVNKLIARSRAVQLAASSMFHKIEF